MYCGGIRQFRKVVGSLSDNDKIISRDFTRGMLDVSNSLDIFSTHCKDDTRHRVDRFLRLLIYTGQLNKYDR